MGYYTSFELDMLTHNGEELDWELQENRDLINYHQGIIEKENQIDMCSSTWNEWEEYMKEYSKLHPNYIFELDGDGDESGDKWRYWFWNGRVYGGYAEIIYPKFNLDALKNQEI